MQTGKRLAGGLGLVLAVAVGFWAGCAPRTVVGQAEPDGAAGDMGNAGSVGGNGSLGGGGTASGGAHCDCRDGNVLACDAGGQGTELVVDCGRGRACNPEVLACQRVICVAGAVDCKGSRVTQCNSSGTVVSETGLDCANRAQFCEAGQCHDPICTPGSSTCVDGKVVTCNDLGSKRLAEEVCLPMFHCQQVTPTFADCESSQCATGEQVCDGNLVKTCTDGGTLPAQGADCGVKRCYGGVCLPKICNQSSRVCDDQGNLRKCVASETQLELVRQCAEGTHCGPLLDGFDCVARPCDPGTTACLGNVRGTCAPDGETLSAVAQNCGASGQVCTAAVACSAVAVDSQGSTEDVEGFGVGSLLGNVVDVHSKRGVTKLEAHLILDAPRDLRWVIYEWTGQTFELRLNEVTTNNGPGSQFFASGPLVSTLMPGRRYFLGVMLVVGEGSIYYDHAPWTRTLSFANSLGAASGSATETYAFDPQPDRIYRMRITTEAP